MRNKWKKIRKIKIRPVGVILALLMIAVFSRRTAGMEIEDTNKGECCRRAGTLTAGITKATMKRFYPEQRETEPMIEVKAKEPEREQEQAEEEKKYWEEIPLSEELQEAFYTYCEKYGCPLAFALATAEVESAFRMDVVGSSGERKIMQLIPGPGGTYYEELERQTGMDPNTDEGNIACGCFLLGKYLGRYGDMSKASMAYNMGTGRAIELWQQGITRSEYSEKVQNAYRKWAEVVENK